MSEIWKKIEGYPKYLVSNLGRVRGSQGGILTAHKSANGYLKVALSKNSKNKGFTVHRLVLAAFVGPCPAEHECDHINSIRTDNRLENLRWLTCKENRRLASLKKIGMRYRKTNAAGWGTPCVQHRKNKRATKWAVFCWNGTVSKYIKGFALKSEANAFAAVWIKPKTEERGE